MKRFRLHTLALCISIITLPLTVPFLTGCVTTTSQPDIQRIAAAVQEAARFGTQEAIRDRPDWQATFVLVRDQLDALALRDKLTVADLLDAVSLLPISEFSSDGVRIAFAAARLTIALANWSDVEVLATEQVRPVISALAKGITAGLPVGNESLSNRTSARAPVRTPKHYKIKK